jgi:hypothetical protein
MYNDQDIERHYHPENFTQSCRSCGAQLTEYGECYVCDHTECDTCGENLAACVCDVKRRAYEN